jgi:hypothetical protein
MSHETRVTGHGSRVTSHESRVTSHESPAGSHQWPARGPCTSVSSTLTSASPGWRLGRDGGVRRAAPHAAVPSVRDGNGTLETSSRCSAADRRHVRRGRTPERCVALSESLSPAAPSWIQEQTVWSRVPVGSTRAANALVPLHQKGDERCTRCIPMRNEEWRHWISLSYPCRLP